ncbi:uncharacterized protein BXZ73DRAFT_37778 [Epithele typhae]|uniref:uncharacterized protein n=1 Tax=Epithele typhae TaxID=378194 RepID=UPI0020087825|nr:uncharacterized protein BXZ73DRAFT_37778 [Epithele typhae]KAH9946112.1 hypothetical protein BXZ73DRAFT_37778 [Epithele typhae]
MSDKASSSRARLLHPAPEELRDLVLDYLVHNCYTNAARAFVRDSSVKPIGSDGDEAMASPVKEIPSAVLDSLEERLAMDEFRKGALPSLVIRTNLLTGRIDEATALLNKHFPAVLAEPMDEDSDLSTASRFNYVPSTSVEPSHLALNLRIQAFIETARRIPLLYCPPGASTPLDPPPLLLGPPGADDEHENSEANTQLLHRAQSLYSEANQLPDKNDRVMYLNELASVGGILAYSFPEESPLADYMSQERREGIADQIDGAILYRAKQPAVSQIELYTRYTSTVWGMLHEKETKVPSRSVWPPGAFLPPSGTHSQAKVVPAKDTGSRESAAAPVKKQTAEKETEEILPRFDLGLFVESPNPR